MSVIVKGMDELPEDGAVLVVRHYDDGTIYIKYAGTYGYSMQLVKLPDKHGRLVDADEIPWNRGANGDVVAYPDTIAEMPTIVEAEDYE